MSATGGNGAPQQNSRYSIVAKIAPNGQPVILIQDALTVQEWRLSLDDALWFAAEMTMASRAMLQVMHRLAEQQRQQQTAKIVVPR